MGRSIYTPFCVATTVNCFCLLLIYFIRDPNQFTRNANGPEENNRSTSLPGPEEPFVTTAHSGTTLIASTQSSMDDRGYKPLFTEYGNIFLNQYRTLRPLLKHPASWFCLVSYFLKRIAFASEGFMFQYASEMFLWPLYQTTWLRVAQASGAITATLVVCPFLALFLSQRGVPADLADLSMIHSALLILTLSFLSFWRASSAKILIIGMKPPKPTWQQLS